MAKWDATPFKTLEQAHKTAEKMGLFPGEIITKGEYKFFQLSEGRKVTTLARHILGGPVKERTEKKAKRYRDPRPTDVHREWVVGKWIRTDHKSLEDAEAHYKEAFINPENVEVIRVIMFRDKDRETEYAADRGGVWTRVITRSPLRDEGYRKAVEAQEQKAREDGTLR